MTSRTVRRAPPAASPPQSVGEHAEGRADVHGHHLRPLMPQRLEDGHRGGVVPHPPPVDVRDHVPGAEPAPVPEFPVEAADEHSVSAR